jgi:hypothetical protein
MSDRPSQPAGSTRQPFRLLDLPRELLIPIVRSYRSPIKESDDGMVIYMGEEEEERYEVLRDLCLTHRDILPFAQEELFKRLEILSDERMNLLNRSIASSERCKEYASRTESIYVEWDVNTDKLAESGALNPRELDSRREVYFSTLSKSCFNLVIPLPLTMISSTDQFQNLRRIRISGAATFDEELVLPNLEMYDIYQDGIYQDDPLYANSTAFKSVNLPNLRRLLIQHSEGAESFGHIYDSIVPQLDHIALTDLLTGDFDHILGLSTSLQSLHIHCIGPNAQTPTIRHQLVNLDVKEFRYTHEESFEGEDWVTHLGSIKVFKEVTDKNDNLKAINLTFDFNFIEELSEDACDQSLAWWKGIKEEMRLICVRKEIKVLHLRVSITSGPDDALAWEDQFG